MKSLPEVGRLDGNPELPNDEGLSRKTCEKRAILAIDASRCLDRMRLSETESQDD